MNGGSSARAVLVLCGVLVAACAPVDEPPGSPTAVVATSPCPVTLPEVAPEEIRERLFGSGAAIGTDELWVGGLGTDGVIVADRRMVEPDGSIGWKFGWWRFVPGTLSITARQLDGAGASIVGSAPDGYGATGFQPSGVSFPTEGCWEVTGAAGAATLSFVTSVEVAD